VTSSARQRGMAALTQEKLAQPMFGAQAVGLGSGSRPDQITQRLVLRARDPDGRKITTAQQAGEFEGIAAVGLELVTGPHWDQRRRHDDTVEIQRRELTL